MMQLCYEKTINEQPAIGKLGLSNGKSIRRDTFTMSVMPQFFVSELYSAPKKYSYYLPKSIVDWMNIQDEIGFTERNGVYTIQGTNISFTVNQIPPIDENLLDEVKAENQVIDFCKNKYFKYVSPDGKTHKMMSSSASIGIIPTEFMRGVPPDEELNKYSYFWNHLLSSDPINFTYRGERIPNEQLRQWLDESGIQHGFFTVKIGERESVCFYSATKQTSVVMSKERYDEHYQMLVQGIGFMDEYEAGTVFHIAGKDYVMSESHTLDIPYGEDIYDMRWPAKDFSSKKVKN